MLDKSKENEILVSNDAILDFHPNDQVPKEWVEILKNSENF